MKFAIVDTKNGDVFEEIFDDSDSALEKADSEWNGMTEYDKKRRSSYFVCGFDPDEDGCIDMETAILLKRYK